MDNDNDNLDEITKEYLHHAHRMQTGVAFRMQRDSKETDPKHLRVGINSAMSDIAALSRLLIEKGIITKAEYARAVRDQMKLEADAYQEYASRESGGKIILGSLY